MSYVIANKKDPKDG